MRVICCGTPYRGDDAAGLLVAEGLHQLNIAVSTCTGEATDLLLTMDGAEEVLIVDAVISGAPAGTISEWHDGTTEFRHHSSTTHALGVAEGIALARELGKTPRQLHIYSIEARTFEIGREISPEVTRAADELAKYIANLIAERRSNIAVH